MIDTIRTWLGDIDTISASLPIVSSRDSVAFAEDSVSIRFKDPL